MTVLEPGYPLCLFLLTPVLQPHVQSDKTRPGMGGDQARNRGPPSLGPTTAARYPDQSITTTAKGVNVSGSNPDPYEDKITGLEPGGGAPPGETPPGEASTAGPQGHDENGTTKGAQILWMAGIAAVVLLSLLDFVGYIVGLLD